MTTYTLGFTGAEIDSRLGSAGTALQPSSLSDLAQTWNDAGTTFTGIKLNVTDTASDAASLLMDLQVGGSSKFSVSKAGRITFGSPSYGYFQEANGYIFTSRLRTSSGIDYNGSNWGMRSNGLELGSARNILWSSSTAFFGPPDIGLYRDSAGALGQRAGVTPQTFNLYNTYTDGSNYERGFMKWNSNVLEIGTEALGTGTGRLLQIAATGMFIKTYGLNNFQVGTTSSRTIQFDSQGIVCNAINYIKAKFNNSDFSIGFFGRSADIQKSTFFVIGHDAHAAASTNLVGGDIEITAGSGASASAGAADGGNVYVRGGTGYGTGHDGYVIMDNLPTADPVVAGAIWDDSGTLKISAGV